MMKYLEQLIFYTEQLAIWLNPPAFALIGGLVEEIIAPIPSPFIMTITAGLLKDRNATIFTIITVATAAGFGKTLASVGYYLIGDKTEDLLSSKYSKLFGITHEQIENYHNIIKKKHKDYLILLFLRAVPIFPTIPVSIISGIIKINITTFIITTWIGFTLRALFFLYLGFQGLSTLRFLINQTNKFQNILFISFIVATIFVLIFLYVRQHRQKPQ